MGNLRRTVIIVIALLLSVLSIISCNSAPTDWLEQDSWSQSGPVGYCVPVDWSSNVPPVGSIWYEFMNSHNGLGMLSRIDPTESAELTMVMLKPLGDGDDIGSPNLGVFTESAAEMLMNDYSYLDSGSIAKTEVSGYTAYEIDYHGSNEGIGVEGRFTAIAGSTVILIIIYAAPAEEWDHFGPIYDRIKSNICFAAEKDADGNWELCLPQLR